MHQQSAKQYQKEQNASAERFLGDDPDVAPVVNHTGCDCSVYIDWPFEKTNSLTHAGLTKILIWLRWSSSKICRDEQQKYSSNCLRQSRIGERGQGRGSDRNRRLQLHAVQTDTAEAPLVTFGAVVTTAAL